MPGLMSSIGNTAWRFDILGEGRDYEREESKKNIPEQISFDLPKCFSRRTHCLANVRPVACEPSVTKPTSSKLVGDGAARSLA